MSVRKGRTLRGEPWTRFALRALVVLALILVGGAYLCDRFRIGLDDQQSRCLGPWRWYLIDTQDRVTRRGQLVAFAATEAMAPYFRPGQTVIKRVVGLPGDRVSVDIDGTVINGDLIPNSDPALARTLGKPRTAFAREQTIPNDQLWVMGDTRDSFDARYWGSLPMERVIGQAYALF